MQILAIINGEYGRRHVGNICLHAPAHWSVETWNAPSVFPLVIDYPEDYLPDSLPPTDLILSFAEHRGVAELIPEIAKMTGAKAVIAGVDNENWLPRGLARQLRGWLEKMDIPCVTPKPLCTLTELDYGIGRRKRITYYSTYISEFASHFGQPKLELEIDPQERIIKSIKVHRDAVCGCARFVAQALVRKPVGEAEQEAGLAHHHFPCLASMGIDSDYGDTLMHISGNVLKDNIAEQVKRYKIVQYIHPGTQSRTDI